MFHITMLCRMLTEAFDGEKCNASILNADRKAVVLEFAARYFEAQKEERERRAYLEKQRLLMTIRDQFDSDANAIREIGIPTEWIDNNTLPVPDPAYRKSKKSTS